MSPAPAVLLFHGYSPNAAFMSAYAKFPALADAHGFIGLIRGGSSSPQFWKSAASADGPDCPRAWRRPCVAGRRLPTRYRRSYDAGGRAASLIWQFFEAHPGWP